MVTAPATEKVNAEVTTAASLSTSERNATTSPVEAMAVAEPEWTEWPLQQPTSNGATTMVAKSESADATYGIDAMMRGTSLSTTLKRILHPGEYTSSTRKTR